MFRCLYLLRRSHHTSLSPFLRVSTRHVAPCSSLLPSRTEQPSRPILSQPHPFQFPSHHHLHRHRLCTVSRATAASKPRAVIFDLGGVVVPSPQAIFDNFEESHDLERGSLVATIKSRGNGGAFAKMERGEYSIEEFCQPFREEYLSHTGRDLSMDQVREFVRALSDFTKLTPHSCVLEMFRRLRSEGIKVAILTNNFRSDSGRTVFPEKELENVDVVSAKLSSGVAWVKCLSVCL